MSPQSPNDAVWRVGSTTPRPYPSEGDIHTVDVNPECSKNGTPPHRVCTESLGEDSVLCTLNTAISVMYGTNTRIRTCAEPSETDIVEKHVPICILPFR